jgi:integration host factor subunit alpha
LDKVATSDTDPATGDDMMMKARRVVTVKCSGKLREKINGK